MRTELRKINQYQKILGERRYCSREDVREITSCPCDYKTGNTPPPASSFSGFSNGDSWGSGKDSHAWFHLTLTDIQENTVLLVLTDKKGWDAGNPQFLAYVNGEIRQGLDTNHLELRLDVGKNDIYLYGYTGPDIESAKLFLSVARVDTDAAELFYDIQYPLEMLDYLGEESGEYAEILQYLYRAVSMLDFNDPDAYGPSVRAAHEFLRTEFYGNYCTPQKATTVCIGHTHIDCAWLWTLRQTREKAQRSFATVLELMKRYPEYRFMSSQPLLYQDLKEEAPELYRQICERIREGRWEADGAMWVEADCNLSSGESLVRQVLYGKRFFRDEFGVESHILWLPDVFGYSAALPQILRKSGVDWFVTSKISWNDTNQVPYDTFLWKGIDGTPVNTYFLTAQKDKGQPSVRHTTYVGKTDAQMIAGTYKRYHQKNLNNEVLLTFGFGDGGGGPTAEHLELARRGSCGIPGSPNARIGFAGEFLERLERKMEGNPQLPVWQGELYLEFHRGTYTTQAHNKKNNRKGEFLYQNTELLSVVAGDLFGLPYPKEQMEKGWKILLTNQFHDIIPGSSIREVYEQCDIDYAEAFAIGEKISSAAEEKIAAAVDASDGYVVWNPNGFRTEGVAKLNGKTVITPPVAPKGYTVTKAFRTGNHIQIDGKTVQTDRYRVVFDDNWQMVSLYDRENDREVLTPGCVGNELRIYADYPDSYDAWEWQAYSRDSYKTIDSVSGATVVDDGARRGIRLVRHFGKSTITQTVWFYDTLGKIDFETCVDWHQRHEMLKAAFPVDVKSDKATFEIQFGTIERPTHFNTEWDQAKFESCAQKYADLSDGGYGVSILNDCKYGHDIHDGVIQLSLLRSPTYPDPEADQGVHTFTYSLCPHAGTLRESDTVKLAYDLNQPMKIIPATGKKTTVPTEYSAADCDSANIICETVKPAEDGNGTILRFYECANKRTRATVRVGLSGRKAYLCDLMENEQKELPMQNGNFSYTFSNFEIVTVKIR